MRKHLIPTITATALLAVSASCIQDEKPNTECDILTVTLPDSILVSTPQPENNYVVIEIQPDVDISRLAPEFTITAGATISPESGSTQDFLNAADHTVIYTVTSEDREWSKAYRVTVKQTETPSDYYFNKSELDASNNKYTIFREIDADNDNDLLMTWASGNPGYVMCGMADASAYNEYGSDTYKDHIWEFFPTRAVYPDGTAIQTVSDINCFMLNGSFAEPEYIRLQTVSTGTFGKRVGMPIAAGNIFQGYFDLSIAITNPRGATKFGVAYRYKPLTLSGTYRYTPGETFTDGSGNTVDGQTDIFSVYALFFESDDETEYIDGTIHYNDFKHDNMVALAYLTDCRVTSEWTDFTVDFDYSAYGKTIDAEKLATGGYKIGIVLSSSAEGDYFRGAVGSTLDIKNLKVTHE